MNRLCLGLALCLVTTACGAVEPITVEPLEDLISFQIGELVIGAIVYSPCKGWVDLPAGDPLVLDFHFWRHEGEPNLVPRSEDMAVLTDAGGRIVHQFNVLAVRAEIPREALPLIYVPVILSDDVRSDIRLNHVRAVPAFDRYDHR